jgi:hypothetical protein
MHDQAAVTWNKQNGKGAASEARLVAYRVYRPLKKIRRVE